MADLHHLKNIALLAELKLPPDTTLSGLRVPRTCTHYVRNFHVHVDESGRFTLPRRWVSPEPSENIFVLIPKARFILAVPLTALLSNENLSRQELSGGAVVRLRTANRLVIPKGLREQANISWSVILMGAFDRFELWSSDRWDEAALPKA
jgi:DNA-binding transcriptional regulator/RsmH inhibitor MraZ